MEQTIPWYESPYTILLCLSGMASITIALLAWKRRSYPGAVPLIFISLAAAIGQIAYGLALVTDPGEFRMVLAKIRYFGIVTAPVAWLAAAIQYTGRGDWLSPRNILLVAVIPLTTLSLVWTNGSHTLSGPPLTI